MDYPKTQNNGEKMIFKKKCKHEYEAIGNFYKEHLTEYVNCFDKVNAYKRERCKKCGNIRDVLLSSEKFIPEMHRSRDPRKEKYINYLTEKGFALEIDL